MIHWHLTSLFEPACDNSSPFPVSLPSSSPTFVLGSKYLVWLCLSFYSPQNPHTSLIHSYISHTGDTTNFHKYTWMDGWTDALLHNKSFLIAKQWGTFIVKIVLSVFKHWISRALLAASSITLQEEDILKRFYIGCSVLSKAHQVGNPDVMKQ